MYQHFYILEKRTPPFPFSTLVNLFFQTSRFNMHSSSFFLDVTSCGFPQELNPWDILSNRISLKYRRERGHGGQADRVFMKSESSLLNLSFQHHFSQDPSVEYA